MICKNVAAIAALLLSISLHAHAFAVISPALGVKGKAQRGDVQLPSVAKPCGNVNITQVLDSSTAVPLNVNGTLGTFNATIENFDTGIFGSRQIISASVDVTGTGKNWEPAHVPVNGETNPSNVTSQQITTLVPSRCTGGKTKDKCLVSFSTLGGFGNCVVVQVPAQKPRREEDETYHGIGAVGTRAARAMRLSEDGSA